MHSAELAQRVRTERLNGALLYRKDEIYITHSGNTVSVFMMDEAESKKRTARPEIVTATRQEWAEHFKLYPRVGQHLSSFFEQLPPVE